MVDTAAHPVKAVLPPVPLRQWVLSLPFEIRYRLAWDGKLMSAILGVFLRVVYGSYRRQAKQQGHAAWRCGLVSFVQRLGSALNLNPHYHMLMPDVVYVTCQDGAPMFVRAPQMLAGPAISYGVSPFIRIAVTNVPNWAGVASPDMISRMASEVAVPYFASAAYDSAERLGDALVAETCSKHRNFSCEVFITSTEIPALSGVDGPGETTTRSGFIAASCSIVALSLRTTSTSAPSSKVLEEVV